MTLRSAVTISPEEIVENEGLEVRMLLESIFMKYGYDFRNYAKASIKRRVKKRMATLGLDSISELQHQILYDPTAFDALLLDLSVSVTEMFRDPSFFKALRERVLPALSGLSHIRIWHAGCATGEEVYSMAILLQEVGLYDKTRIYATDLNEVVLRKAKEGIFPIDRVREYTANYQRSGGTESFADYYSAGYESVIMEASLKENILFAAHNLSTDWVFGEMDMVVCRNVLIYFDRSLQNRIFGLFAESLADGGVLCIGSKESVRFSQSASCFEGLVPGEKIYRKRAGTVVGDG